MSEIQRIVEHLDRILPQFIQDEPLPGLAVGVVYDHRMIYAKGFGVSDIQSGEAVTEHTLFHMASVSKTLVATGMMQLAEEGVIDLDGVVSDYLPYFEMADDRSRNLTIRQLLSHTSGLPDEDDFAWDRPEYDEGSLERYVRSMKDCKLQREPGQAFAYSNIGYEILGDVIAKVTGLSFELYMKQKLLEPASMLNSTFLKEEAAETDYPLAVPHVLGLQGGYGAEPSSIFPYHRAHAPSSTLYANAVDMCYYALAHLSGSSTPRGDGKLLLEANSYSEMWRRAASTDYGDILEDMGLGWFMGLYRGRRVLSHMGRDTGFRSGFLLLPDEGMGVVFMMNADYVGGKILGSAILNVLLGEDVPYVQQSLAHHLSRLTITSGVDAAFREYEEIQQSCPERFLVIEGEFNAGAYTLMRRGWLQEGIRLLELSVQIFPGSSNLHDSLGEMYLLAGERALALMHYEKSVELDPEHAEGIRMVNELLQSN
ncbi:serine hydrolase [Paenibacillus glucanolyticus]|uniref:serine hydrolase n=1 Tax=Paenibacillus glucanolyticus TaxID=59843 RepID=UPI00368039A2